MQYCPKCGAAKKNYTSICIVCGTKFPPVPPHNTEPHHAPADMSQTETTSSPAPSHPVSNSADRPPRQSVNRPAHDPRYRPVHAPSERPQYGTPTYRRPYYPNRPALDPEEAERRAKDKPSVGYAILGFFFSVIGLILYLTWRKSMPQKAMSCARGALIGAIVKIGFLALIAALLYFFAPFVLQALPYILIGQAADGDLAAIFDYLF